MSLRDSHVHASLFPDVKRLVESCHESNLEMLGVSCSYEDSIKNVKLADTYHYLATVGIHPWFAKDDSFDEAAFALLLKSPYVVGVGECGLDADIELPLSVQESLLRKQLDFAVLHNLPVNLHIRKAHGQLIKILKSYQGKLTGVVHNFTFSKEIAKSYLDLGFLLSVGHLILQKNARSVAALQYASLEHILLETDYDFIHTGPYDTSLMWNEAKVLSEIFNKPLPMIEAQLTHNGAIFKKE